MLGRAGLRRRALLTQIMPGSPFLLLCLLLPLGLGGCWDRATRARAAFPVSSEQYGRRALPGDELPTPRLFQIDLSQGQSE